MRARDLLADRIAHAELCPGSRTVDDWLREHWVRFRIGRRTVPLIPLWGLEQAHVAHDTHHALLGFPTTLRGECEIAAWELASGGCGWNGFFWIDRLLVLALGLVRHPCATIRALRGGLGRRNLSGMRIDRILAADVEDLRRLMRV